MYLCVCFFFHLNAVVVLRSRIRDIELIWKRPWLSFSFPLLTPEWNRI